VDCAARENLVYARNSKTSYKQVTHFITFQTAVEVAHGKKISFHLILTVVKLET
jgi:hypothetical protein